MLRSWLNWVRLFEPLVLLAVAGQSAGVLAMTFEAPPMLSGGLVLAGEVITAILAARLWRATRQALDMAAGFIVSQKGKACGHGWCALEKRANVNNGH